MPVIRTYVPRDMSCPESKLHSLPRSDQRLFTIYLSVEDSYHLNVDPICKLAVRVPQVINMYQTMRLAQHQYVGTFNFSARSDDLRGFTMQHINNKWVRQRIAEWVLYDVDAGQRIPKSIADVFLEDGKSYSWVYTRYSNIRDTYQGDCRSVSRSRIRPAPSMQHAILYISVQFWSDIWPLCKLPVLITDSSRINLNDLMMETKRQYKHLFVFQRYETYQLYDINELHDEGGYTWQAQVADSNRELSDILYLVPLEDGDHVIWRYVNGEGEPRYKTVEPELAPKVTPSVELEDREAEETYNVDARTGNEPGHSSSHIAHFTPSILAIALLLCYLISF